MAAKLLGWRVDIKSEEEKRQEVEHRMAELVVPGAPVAVLLDHGLTDDIAEALITGGVPTVERLGAMTPEQLEAIPGIGPDVVERIQQAVMGYYGQFEGSVEGEAAAEAAGEIAAAEAGPENAVESENAGAGDASSPEEPQKQSVTIDSGEPSVGDSRLQHGESERIEISLNSGAEGDPR